MPSKPHENKIEQISRDILSRGMEWKTKKQFPIWLPNENAFGLIDVVGFKKASNISPGIVEGYEVEQSSGSLQQNRNAEKLKQLESSFPSNVIVKTCQMTAQQDHEEVCFRNPQKNNHPNQRFRRQFPRSKIRGF